jgi:hypothetical protein
MTDIGVNEVIREDRTVTKEFVADKTGTLIAS